MSPRNPGHSIAVVVAPVGGSYEPELHLNGDALVPDLAGWRRERMPALPQTSAFELAPDWVCEVLSPSTAAIDRTVKIPVYAREGVGYVWLIDPLAQTLEVLRLGGVSYRFVGAWNGDAVRSHPSSIAWASLTSPLAANIVSRNSASSISS